MTVPEILYSRAREAGFTVEGACALLAQIQAESAFQSNNAENRINRVISDEEYVRRADAGLETYNGKNFIYDAVGFGYAQWTYWSRKKYLYEFCKGRGVSVADHEAQKEFIFVEMQRDFPTIWTLCRTSHDLRGIVEKLIQVWENPADHKAAMAERYPYAQAWYSKFNGWNVPANETVNQNDSVSSNEPINPPTLATEENAKVDDEGVKIEETWPPRTIQEGLNWKETYLLQSLLSCRGYNILINGIFNESLALKVREFQNDNGLTVDGVVGPKTWKTLLRFPAGY